MFGSDEASLKDMLNALAAYRGLRTDAPRCSPAGREEASRALQRRPRR
jgi:hypothetical protein